MQLTISYSVAFFFSLIVTAWVHHNDYSINNIKGPYEQSVHHAKMLVPVKL